MKSINREQMKAMLNFEVRDYSDYSVQWDEVDRIYNSNWAKLEAVDKAARDRGELVGRFIREGVADGYALYMITKENKKTVRITHISGLGDDYMIQYWGWECMIEKDFAVRKLRAEDFWNDQRSERLQLVAPTPLPHE